MQQVDVKNKSLQEQIETQEKAKRQLEDELDTLNSKLAGAANDAYEAEAQQQHQKLVAQLRDQIALKNSQIQQLSVCLIKIYLLQFFLGIIARNANY